MDQVYDAIRHLNVDQSSEAAVQSSAAAIETTAVADDEEEKLAILIALEERLAADLQRKPGHQKPALQQQWQSDIATLRAQLGLDN